MASKGAKGRIEKQEEWRNAIKTTLILKRVNNHVLAKPEDENYQQAIMTPSQIKGAELLLRKTMPDLKAIEGVIDLNASIIKPLLPDYLKDAD